MGNYTFLLYIILGAFDCIACNNNQRKIAISDHDSSPFLSPGVSAPGDVFSPSFFSSDVSEAPQLGEWTYTAGPDESIVVTGYHLSSFSGIEEGKDSRFMVYGTGGVRKEAKIQRLDGDKAILTLDGALPSWSMYLLQPGNEAGWGKAVAVNKTDAWWVQDKAAAGMSVSVYGRNLAHGNVEGLTNSNVYIKSSATGGGQWASVSKVNPYRVDFTLPSSLAAGQYELWLHNGHGGDWGWSGPLKLQVVASSEHILTKGWGSIVNVKDYGARGDGINDDRIAINQALAFAGANGSTIYFPSGIYMVSGLLDVKSNSRWLGDIDGNGKPNSTIQLMAGAGFGIIKGYSLKLNLFENLRLISNGQKVENHEVVEMYSCQMMRWNNCEIDSRGGDAMRFQGDGANHIYLTNTIMSGGVNQWGKVIYIEGLRQFFADNCTFKMTGDCSGAIVNRGIKEASVTNCTIKDMDNTTTDGSGWGKGRIWSSTGSAGSQYHQYFAGNKGIGLGTRISGSNLPDNNSGEIFLWEANQTKFEGTPTSASATTISFSSTPSNTGSDGVSRSSCLFIYNGKGTGQFRKVINQSAGLLTIDRPWGVIPDGSSQVAVGFFVQDIVVYKNSLDASGKSYIANGLTHTASAGVQPYGGCFNFIVDNNTMQGLRRGTTIFTYDEGGSGIQPNYFHYFVNNKIMNCRYGIYNGSLNEREDGVAMMGLVYRKNTIEQPVISGVQNDVKYASTAILKAFVYEHNLFSGAPVGFQTGSMYSQDPAQDYGSGALDNQLFYKNSFAGSLAAIRLTPKIVLRENTYQGFSTIYKGLAIGSTVVEAPYHVVEINAAPGAAVIKTPFTLVNAGSAPLLWTATSNTQWLKLSTLTGTIPHEGEKVLLIISHLKELAHGQHKGNFTITQAGQIKSYTVLLNVNSKKLN